MTTEAERGWLTPMRARSAEEEHRASTPLELFFDLCFVAAVAQAVAPLHHGISEGHAWHGVSSFLMVFFAIWWAWMNFSWFASAYDTDDDVYRITAFAQIAGALVLAAGIRPAFDGGDFLVITIGYVIMRLAMVAQWLRAARSDPLRRATALRYAAGIALVEAGWVARLAVPESGAAPVFVLLVAGELLVPIVAERAPGGPTTWHPHHIAERYGLFTIIMLGEAVSAATIAIRTGLDFGEHVPALVSLAVAGLVVVFALWWLYFDRSAGGLLTSLPVAMLWGYGHYFIFASAAAVGAGLSVAVDHYSHPAHVSAVAAGYALAVPVALYLFFVWLLHIRPHRRRPLVVAYLVGAALTLLAPLGPAPVHVVAGLLAVLVGITVTLGRRRPAPAVPSRQTTP